MSTELCMYYNLNTLMVKINEDFKPKHFSLFPPEWCQHEIGMTLSCQLAMLVVSS